MKGSFLILLTEQRWSKEQPHLTLILSLLPLHFVVVISTSPVPLHPDTYMQMHIPASRRDAVQEVELECTAFPEELQIKKSVKSAYTSNIERQNLWPFRATWDKPLLLNHKNMWKRKTFIIHWQGRGRFRNCNKLIICKRSNISSDEFGLLLLEVRHERMAANSQPPLPVLMRLNVVTGGV